MIWNLKEEDFPTPKTRFFSSLGKNLDPPEVLFAEIHAPGNQRRSHTLLPPLISNRAVAVKEEHVEPAQIEAVRSSFASKPT